MLNIGIIFIIVKLTVNLNEEENDKIIVENFNEN